MQLHLAIYSCRICLLYMYVFNPRLKHSYLLIFSYSCRQTVRERWCGISKVAITIKGCVIYQYTQAIAVVDWSQVSRRICNYKILKYTAVYPWIVWTPVSVFRINKIQSATVANAVQALSVLYDHICAFKLLSWQQYSEHVASSLYDIQVTHKESNLHSQAVI